MDTGPISRILSPPKRRTAIYLGLVLPLASSGAPTCAGTALHRGKDFAVSARSCFRDTLRESLYPFRIKRCCSHLAPFGGRALPATLLQFPACVRTFLSDRSIRATVWTGPIQLYNEFLSWYRYCASNIPALSARFFRLCFKYIPYWFWRIESIRIR